MPWWGWIALGAMLFVAEIGFVDMEFYLVFLAASALLVGLVSLAGVELPMWGQWLAFGGLALVSLGFFRKRLYAKIRAGVADLPDNVEGEVGVARARLEPGATGQVELRGTPWTAYNAGDVALDAGDRVTVERIEGLVLRVRKEN